mmetsp:Transcript_5847/g.12718  ORF Transcript_5847/g.12718 Transcript_5847/m.12718 type:complete len:94 (+) Transcript_5847:1333-1614(+)
MCWSARLSLAHAGAVQPAVSKEVARRGPALRTARSQAPRVQPEAVSLSACPVTVVPTCTTIGRTTKLQHLRLGGHRLMEDQTKLSLRLERVAS